MLPSQFFFVKSSSFGDVFTVFSRLMTGRALVKKDKGNSQEAERREAVRVRELERERMRERRKERLRAKEKIFLQLCSVVYFTASVREIGIEKMALAQITGTHL